MTAPEGHGSAPQPQSTARWRIVLPFVLTALLTLTLSLLLQNTLLRPIPPAAIIPTRAVLSAVATVVPTPNVIIATPLTSNEGAVLRQEVTDLRIGQQQIWSAIYLSRALNYLAEAESQLRTNDLQAVDQSLIAVDDSLALAYESADASVQSPITALRRDLDALRDDLFLYSEQTDLRLARLRQVVLALIEQRR